MDKPRVTPKDFFIWAGAMIALYASVFSLVSLLFEYINFIYPDALNAYVDPYSSGMRYDIASLMVLFPLLLVLMRVIRRDITRDASKKDTWVRRWALMLTLFVAGATIAIDLITLINYFLGGDVTTRFILKIVVVLLVAGGGFLHFLADIAGYWITFPKRAHAVGWGAGIVVLASIASGFLIMGSPAVVRLNRFDDQKVNDLTNIQWQIVNYYQQKGTLPAALADLNDPISGSIIPIDAQTQAAYIYKSVAPLSFQLCATFNTASRPQNGRATAYAKPVSSSVPVGGPSDLENQTWQHASGETCFTRTIDPERYPVFKTEKK